ncbi:MAG: hypothetical protein PHX83_13855 [Acidobacteriia bacterium]|nr:hypothetical protein [Terriglobia bacterium]
MAFFADRRRRMMLYAVIVFLLLFAPLYHYYNVFEEMRVKQFFGLVVAGNYQEAYRLWQPTPSYKYNDFIDDWGANSYYAGGRITSYELESSHSRGSFVLVHVKLNGNKEVALVVNKDDKHFSFAP